mmetsp:Transcript_22553/g.33230  ORF Transcript_22553/g.33230 Transcript_22553/m.33230 type:complete len:97 (+) Transcript_22553:139-429(+)
MFFKRFFILGRDFCVSMIPTLELSPPQKEQFGIYFLRKTTTKECASLPLQHVWLVVDSQTNVVFTLVYCMIRLRLVQFREMIFFIGAGHNSSSFCG